MTIRRTIAFAILALPSCSASPSFAEVESADIGPRPLKSVYMKLVSNWLGATLSNPESARISTLPPVPGWYRLGTFKSDKYAWRVTSHASSLRSNGTFAARETYWHFLINDRIVAVGVKNPDGDGMLVTEIDTPNKAPASTGAN